MPAIESMNELINPQKIKAVPIATKNGAKVGAGSFSGRAGVVMSSSLLGIINKLIGFRKSFVHKEIRQNHN